MTKDAAPHPPQRKRKLPREVWTLLGGVTVVLIGFLAIPRLVNPGDDITLHEAEIVPLPPEAQRPAVRPVTATATRPGTSRPSPTAPADTAGSPAAGPAARDGDLVVEIELRWPSAPTGATLPATVHLRNTGQATFHLPAASEPHPTLALVVLDAEGRVVRRVAEAGVDPYPRRTAIVRPAATLDLPVDLVAGGDRALPPGEYTVFAELRHDPVWERLGIPMWREPSGAARSSQVAFTITAKAP